VRFHWLGHRNHHAHEDIHLLLGKSGGKAMVSSLAIHFILHRQGHVQQQRRLPLADGPENGGGSACRTAHARDYNIRIQNQSHITHNIISDPMLRARIG
jgi:hypothetical protein